MIVRRITTDIHSVSEESHLSLMAVKSAHLSLRACDPLFLPPPPPRPPSPPSISPQLHWALVQRQLIPPRGNNHVQHSILITEGHTVLNGHMINIIAHDTSCVPQSVPGRTEGCAQDLIPTPS